MRAPAADEARPDCASFPCHCHVTHLVRRFAPLLIGCALGSLGGAPLHAQAPAPSDTSHRESQLPLFTWRDAALAGGFGALTVAMFPIDQRVATHLQDSSTQANRFFRNGSKAVQYLADPGAITPTPDGRVAVGWSIEP